MQKRDIEDALGFYDKAEEIRNVLGITECNVSSVYFLKNRGSCLSYLGLVLMDIFILHLKNHPPLPPHKQ